MSLSNIDNQSLCRRPAKPAIKKPTRFHKNYIVDEQDKKIAVQIPIETFEKIKEVLENYALYQMIKENEGEDLLELGEAKEYYDRLEKTK